MITAKNGWEIFAFTSSKFSYLSGSQFLLVFLSYVYNIYVILVEGNLFRVWIKDQLQAKPIFRRHRTKILKHSCAKYVKELDDHGELFLRNGWPTKGFKSYFQSRLSSEVLIIA